MTSRASRAAAVLAAVTALTLTAACGADSGSKTTDATSCKEEIKKLFDETAKDPQAVETSEKPAACEGFTEAELEKMTKDVMLKKIDNAFDEALGAQAGEDEQAAEKDLAVGDTYTYSDGLAVTVDSIEKLTEFGEYDEKPSEDETAFRITVTIDNGTDKSLSLDDVYLGSEGATNGGEVTSIYVEAGSKEMTGRVAAGVKTTKTSEFVIADEYGKKVVATFTRMDPDAAPLAGDPDWTGTIQ